MARRNADVENVEDVETTPESTEEGKTPKAKKEPKRGTLPEGYVTPIGLAHELTTRKLHTNRAGETVEVRPQMVYSYIKNAPKDDQFPMETVQDSLGKERQAVQLDAGVAWWERKNERVAQRKANAAAKAEKKAAKAAQSEGSEDSTPAEEAE